MDMVKGEEDEDREYEADDVIVAVPGYSPGTAWSIVVRKWSGGGNFMAV